MNPTIRLLTTCTRTDSYKASHWLQYPPGTQFISSYIESRGGQFPNVVFFGLQPWLQDLQELRERDVTDAEELFTAHGLPFNGDGWRDMVKRHDGKLPVEIQALKEGTVVPTGTPMVQVRNTDPRYPWLTSYLETALVRAVWYPSTVATLSREAKKTIYAALVMTADDPDAEILFKLHDFGGRGVSSGESAMLGGMAHLVNFMGTDTVEALVGAKYYYREPMAGFSIPAAEHSTITAWGKAGEGDAFKNMIDQFMKPGKLVAVVSDSYDVYNAVSDIWGGRLKDRVQQLGSRGGTLVVRPDSGVPKDVVFSVITRLMDSFGYTTNTKGFKVLPNYLRVIQGDGCNLDSIAEILTYLSQHGISASNVAFGMGGGLLQKVDRDTCSFAMKANEITVNGETRDVYKAPLTDSGKVSKKGRQAVVKNPATGRLEAVREDCLGHRRNELELVYKDGLYFREQKFSDVRARASLVRPQAQLQAAE